MKKSTLFFKVMVLLALLVPWTGTWGQDDVASIANNDEIWGTGPTIYVNSEGKISDDGVSYSDKITIQFDDVQDQNDGNWQFGDEIDPSNLPITVSPSSDGKSVTLSVKENTDISEINEVTFKVAADNNGGQRKGWIQFGLSTKSKTNIADETAITITINGDADSKVYNGDAISISVKTMDGAELEIGTDYQVYIDDNKTAITTANGLPKDVKGEDTEEGAYSIVIEGIGEQYYGKTTAENVTITRRPIMVTLKADPKLEFEIGESASNLSAEEYTEYFNIQANTTDAGLAGSESAKVSGTFSVNTESAGEQTVNTESLTLVDVGSTGFKANNYDISWGGENGLKVTVSKKDFSDMEDGGTISITQDGKEYDGAVVSDPVVKDGEETLTIGEDYTVEYYQGETKLNAAPIHAGDYKVVIKGTGSYEEGKIEKTFTITPQKVTVKGSYTATVGEEKKESYSAEDLGLTGSANIGEETVNLTFSGTATATDAFVTTEVKEEISGAFNVGEAGKWTINISDDFTHDNYQKGDIEIESIAITLDVVADDDWTATSNKKAELTVYILSTGEIIGCDNDALTVSEFGMLPITLDNVSNLTDWVYSLADAGYNWPVLSPEQNKVDEGGLYTWSVPEKFKDRLNLTVNNTETATAKEYAALCESEGIKVKIENGDAVGHILLKFEKKQLTITKDDIIEGGEGDEEGNIESKFYGEGADVIYDSYTHSLAILKTKDGRTLFAGTDYTVTYTATEGDELVGDEKLPYHAGTYTATINLQGDYTSTEDIVLEGLTIKQCDLLLSFIINEKVDDLNATLSYGSDVTCEPKGLADNDDGIKIIANATFSIGTTAVEGLYPVYLETIQFNTEEFDPTDYNISCECCSTSDLTGEEGSHEEEINPGEDGEVNLDTDDPIGGIEYVDPETGEGSAGGYYEKKYRLYLAVKDKNNYYVEDAEADYKAEGLELFSRRDKKTTWAGGSFTVYYKHNDVVNEGGYRVFIKRGKHADYEEVKLDEVSGYYQIRNVQSDIYVRLYYGTGFPVANEEITATDARAYAQANKIVVITPEPTDVQIISMAGAVVATDQVTGQREFANLAEGVYIVRMGETVIKLQVRN